jgi:hypothetical protein
MVTEAVGGAGGARWLRLRLGFLSCRGETSARRFKGGPTKISDKAGRRAGTERQVIEGGRETENVSKLGATGHAFSTYCAGAAGLFSLNL